MTISINISSNIRLFFFIRAVCVFPHILSLSFQSLYFFSSLIILISIIFIIIMYSLFFPLEKNEKERSKKHHTHMPPDWLHPIGNTQVAKFDLGVCKKKIITSHYIYQNYHQNPPSNSQQIYLTKWKQIACIIK